MRISKPSGLFKLKWAHPFYVFRWDMDIALIRRYENWAEYFVRRTFDAPR